MQLEKAARLHQDGDLDQAVSILKSVVKSSPQHAEAHASLSKLLFDQGKTSLAEKAMAKATKLNNDKAAQWELFCRAGAYVGRLGLEILTGISIPAPPDAGANV